jgi:hypothetical protein
MIIDDLDVSGLSIVPAENQAPLIVDPNRMKPFHSAFESFQPVSGWHPQIFQL